MSTNNALQEGAAETDHINSGNKVASAFLYYYTILYVGKQTTPRSELKTITSVGVGARCARTVLYTVVASQLLI